MLRRTTVRFARVACFLLPLTLLAGCTSSLLNPIPEARGSLHLQVILADAASGSGHQLEVHLQHQNQRRTELLPIVGSAASVAFEGLLIGVWQVELMVRDDAGDVTHAGGGDLLISADEVLTAQFPLVPQPGELRVYIDLSGIPDATLRDTIDRARVNVTPGGYNSGHRAEGTDTIEVSRTLAPQTYDFQVTLYAEDFLAGNRVYASPWYPVDIRPGKVTHVHWVPSAGDLHVGGTVIGPPSPPELIQVEALGAHRVRLEWSPGEVYGTPQEAGWRIYHRESIFDAYSVIAELPYAITEWEGDVTPHSGPVEHSFAVSAYAIYAEMPETRFESHRSQPVILLLPPET